jgi:hydroxyacylglutathione hydrolase
VSLQVISLQLGVYGTNCYLVAGEGSTSAVVIDPGDEPERVAETLGQRGWTPAGILITHGHIDHVGAVDELVGRYGVEVWREAGGDHPVRDGDTFELAGITFQVIAVPGHEPSSVAYAADGVVFSGDVLFAGSIGRTDLEGGDFDVLIESIRRLAERLPGTTVVASGHGPPTTLEDELRTNPFLESLRG